MKVDFGNVAISSFCVNLTERGTLVCFNDEHPIKALFLICFNVKRLISVNFEHPSNELSHIVVTDVGISIFIKDEQLRNVFISTVLIFGGIENCFNDLQ